MDFPLQRAATAAEVLDLAYEICQPLEAERVSLPDAVGRVLREAVRSPEDQPPFDRSAVDGYAVRQDDPGPQFRIVDEIRAGDWKARELQLGETARIATGGALPCGDLKVVMREDARVEGEIVRVTGKSGGNCIRFRGEDARQGDLLVDANASIQAGTAALMAGAGCANPLVTRKARVIHLATGNEIVAPDRTPGPGQIRDSNSILVRAFLRRWPAELTQERLPEDEAAVRSALVQMLDHPGSPAANGVHLILISGGASVGKHDFTRPLLEDAGFDILVTQTHVRPGKPLIVARRGRTVAFGLPGNPLAHFVCLNLFVRAALEGFSGAPRRSFFQSGELAAKLESGRDARETFWPAYCEWGGRGARLQALRWSSSGDLTSLATANALIRIPAGAPELPAGAMAEFVPVLS